MDKSRAQQWIDDTRRRLVEAEDTVSLERAWLVTEAYQRHADEPVPVRRAKALAHVLDQMTLDVRSNPLLAGNTAPAPRAWMLLPEYGFKVPGQAAIEHPELAHFLDGDVIPDKLRDYWREHAVPVGSSIGHLTIDNARLLSQGLRPRIAEAERPRPDLSPEQNDYRRACALAMHGVIRWAERYAEAYAQAADVADAEGDAERALALQRVATSCRQVPAGPARNLHEALQSLALVHLALHIEGHGHSVSPGRLDQLLVPYQEEAEAKNSHAVALLAAFMLVLASNSLWGRYAKTQAITLGGVDADGRDQCNAWTAAALQAWRWIRVPDPGIYLRWHTNIDSTVKAEAIDMLAQGLSMPTLVGDAQTANGLIAGDVAPRDAWNYNIVGCNELGVPGKLIWDSLSLNGARLLRELLLEEAESINDMDDLLARLGSRIEVQLMDAAQARLARREHRAAHVPTPLTSALMTGCLEQGRDMLDSLYYPHLSTNELGYVNLVDGLSAIQAIIFETQTATLPELAQALADNFDAREPLQQRLHAATGWGHDDQAMDCWAQAWIRIREEARHTVEARLDLPPILTCHVVRSLHHLHGRNLGATADGRPAGTPLADSIGAPGGTSPQGPTAILNSVARLEPARCWTGGYNLNLSLPMQTWGSAELRENLVAMVDAFMATGGQELQIACLDPAELLDAQAHPERHRDLLVRVAGFNARFVELCPAEQDELIQRAKTCSQRVVAEESEP